MMRRPEGPRRSCRKFKPDSKSNFVVMMTLAKGPSFVLFSQVPNSEDTFKCLRRFTLVQKLA